MTDNTQPKQPELLPEQVAAIRESLEREYDDLIGYRAKFGAALMDLGLLLRTHSPAQAEWLPIESAPKDGTFVLVLGDSGYTTTPYRMAVANWIPDYKNCWTEHDGTRFTDGGQPPTHWMPLPQPPKEQLKTFGDGHYCRHHPDDPAHGPRCYEKEHQ